MLTNLTHGQVLYDIACVFLMIEFLDGIAKR